MYAAAAEAKPADGADPQDRARLRGVRGRLCARRPEFSGAVGEAFVWQHENQNYGVAAAYAVLVMAVSLAATVVYLRALRVPREQQS